MALCMRISPGSRTPTRADAARYGFEYTAATAMASTAPTAKAPATLSRGRRGDAQELDGPHHRHQHHQEDAVVDTRQHLQRDEHAGQDAELHPAALDRALHRPERPRNPHRPLQLHVHEMAEAVGREGEDQAGDDRRRPRCARGDGPAHTCRCRRRRSAPATAGCESAAASGRPRTSARRSAPRRSIASEYASTRGSGWN